MDQAPGSEAASQHRKNQVSFLSPELCGPATHQPQTAAGILPGGSLATGSQHSRLLFYRHG